MTNLIQIVQQFRLSLGIVSTDFDQQFLQWAIEGCGKLNELGLMPITTKAVRLPVEGHKAVLPSDFKEMVRMGVCCNGVLINFDKNDDLCLPAENPNCPCDSATIENTINDCSCNGGAGTNGNWGTWNWPIFGQPYSFSYTVGSYGIGPGFYHGGYKIDYANQQILLDNCVQASYITLEYVGDFLNDMGNAVLPGKATFAEAIVIWMDAQRKYWSPEVRLNNMYVQARTRWFGIVRDLNSQQQAMNKHEWVQLFREYMYQGVKA